MRGFRLSERHIALICAVVLVITSIAAAWRQHNWEQDSRKTHQKSQDKNVPSVDGKTDTKSTQASQLQNRPSSPSTVQDKKGDNSYVYTAIAGSSYTEFARQAISTYAATHNISLTSDQTLNAEVSMTNNAGSPLLEIGQTVIINSKSIENSLQTAGAALTLIKPDTAPQSDTPTDTTFQAVAGDSFTMFARQCVATYLEHSSITLSMAQQIAAETYIAQAAGTPQLAIGQQVVISHNVTAQAVQRAVHLSPDEQTAWQQYANMVIW